jgi:uncharacterized iron-regulated protein
MTQHMSALHSLSSNTCLLPVVLLRVVLLQVVFLRAVNLPALLAFVLGFGFVTQSQAAIQSLSSYIRDKNYEFLLLGEVHDNESLHRIRLDGLQNLPSTRPPGTVVLVMEQFDIERQADLDQFLRGLSPADRKDKDTARALAQAAGFRFEGWKWVYYEPVIQLALSQQWPIVAANLSREEAMKVARGGPTPMLERFQMNWTHEENQLTNKMIQEGHCGLLPEARVPAMARAQQERDAHMASVLLKARATYPGFQVVLLAGNGHIRNDLGVPRYLMHADPRARIFTWGLLEIDQVKTLPKSLYTEVWGTNMIENRDDPCEDLKKRMAPR